MNGMHSEKWHALVEGRVYLSLRTGHINADTMHDIDREFGELIDASPYAMVHAIFDLRAIVSIPPLNEMGKVQYPHHPRSGYSITVGAFQNPLMRFLVSMASAIVKSRSKDVSTLTEGYLYLAEKDASLPPVQTWTHPPSSTSAAS
jgi:hypothetical protein